MQNRPSLPRPLTLLLALLVFAACDDEPSGPQRGYTIRVQSGDDQFAGFGQQLENPLQVVVENASTGDPVPGVLVQWSVVEGAGASVTPSASQSDVNGIASTALVLGPADASYRVRATVPDLVGRAVTFDATAVTPARIDSVAPGNALVGDTIRIYGSSFAPTAADNTVLIAGFRAHVVEVNATHLRVAVPACTPTRSDASVRVDRGIVQSNVRTLDVTGSASPPTQMAVGEVLHLADAAALDCLRLGPSAGAQYLVVLQNATSTGGVGLDWRLTAATSGLLAAPHPFRVTAPDELDMRSAARSSPGGDQQRLDLRLREIEAAAARHDPAPAGAQLRSAPPGAPAVDVGDRRDFWVFRRAGDYERVTAVVRHISEHAILYEDLDAPEDGFQPADFQAFGAVFDDPIYETMTGVYGAPSDVDGNGRVIILFTPVVNRMTPPGSGNAFVAGFFFGIDLLDGQSRGNDAEVFYTLVPDPDGEFGNVRTFEQMLSGVPPVMAHEFQHMIHFNQRILQRDGTIEHTWLSEGLAHTAEELVADAYTAIGRDTLARSFRLQNYLRADIFLGDPAAVSPLGPAVPLAVRGASWLLVEYLRSHFGGDPFLAAVTQTTATGVANLTANTGLDWGTILHRWGVALWADDAGIPGLDPVYTFPDLSLRLAFENAGFPLVPAPLPWTDFTRTGALPSAASRYWILDGSAALAPLNIAVAGRHSPLDASDRPQLSVLRIQ